MRYIRSKLSEEEEELYALKQISGMWSRHILKKNNEALPGQTRTNNYVIFNNLKVHNRKIEEIQMQKPPTMLVR